MYRKRGYIVARIIGTLMVLVMAALVAIQTPYFQTRLSKIALGKLAAIMDGRVQYDELKVMTSGVLVLRNVVILDANPYREDAYNRGWAPVDTVFRARTITATFTISGLFKGEGIHMGRVTIEDGLFHLASEPDGQYKNNLTRIFKIPPGKGGPAKPGPNIFDIKKVIIKNFRFRLNNFHPQKRPPKEFGINFQDLDVRCNVTGHNLRFAGGKMSGVCDRLQAWEKSGYIIEDCTGSCSVGLGSALIEDLHLKDPWSDIRLRYYSMTYAWGRAFAHFVDEVSLGGDFRRTQVAARTLSYFVPKLKDNPTVLDIRHGVVSGPVRQLKVERFAFSEKNTDISADLDAALTGLPKVADLAVNAQVREFSGTTDALARLLSAFSRKGNVKLGPVPGGIPFKLAVNADGPLDRLALQGTLDTSEGSARFDGMLRDLLDRERPLSLSTSLSTQELDLGRLLGVKALGPVTLRTHASATLGAKGRLPDATIDSLQITGIRALGHDFAGIGASGILRGGTLVAHLRSTDPAARMEFTLLGDIPPKENGSRYRAEGTFNDVDLRAFGIKGPFSKATTRLNGDVFLRDRLLDGNVTLSDISVTADDGAHEFGDISLRARGRGGQEYTLSAPFLDASYSGTQQIDRFIKDLLAMSVQRDLPSLFPARQAPSPDTPGEYAASVHFHDTRTLLPLVVPGAYIADGTQATLNLRSGIVDGALHSGRVALGTKNIRDLQLRFDNRSDAISAELTGEELRLGPNTMKRPTVKASADNDHFLAGVAYESFAGAAGEAEIQMDGVLARDAQGALVVRAHPVDSYLTAGDDIWIFDPNDILLKKSALHLDRFAISNGPQRLYIDGGYSTSQADTLSLQMDRFDLALVNAFLPATLGLGGIMDGQARISSGAQKAFGMEMDFVIDTLRLSGQDAGTVQLSSAWHKEGEELGLNLSDILDGREALRASGSFFTADKRMDATVRFDQLPLSIASPFLSGVFSEIGGGISGQVAISGPLDHLAPVSEDLMIDDALLRVAMTGVPYTVRGPILIDRKGILFDALQISDDTGGSGTLSGTLSYNDLKDFALDSRLRFADLKLVDAPERPDGAFYGLLRASGSAAVTGPFNALVIDADVRTSGDGNIHIPLSGSLSSSSSNLLTFTEPPVEQDEFDLPSTGRIKSTTPSDVYIRGQLTLHPGLKAYAEIDKTAGNVASFNGSGTIGLNLRPSKAEFRLTGQYDINEGNYQFVIPGILNKGFSIQRGSSVKFGGDLMNTELDLNATYTLRTSIEPLIGSESASRRTVTCGINISDRLRSPQLNLSVDIPDLDPTVRSIVEGALNTSDKVQKQFVSLLLLGSFLPDEGSGVVNRSNPIFSNVMEMMSSRLSGILQRLEIPLDVGFGYQSGESGQDLFDVAVSTELFDNRVIVGGNFGNRRYSTGSTSGDFAGNLDIQVKLDPEGKFRFIVFSHSADEFTNYLDFSQRNGIGVSYQKEYRDLADFASRLFISKKNRAAREQAQAERALQLKTIHITNESGKALPDPDPAGAGHILVRADK